MKLPASLKNNSFIAPAILTFITENMSRFREERLHIEDSLVIIYTVLDGRNEPPGLASAAAQIYTRVRELAAATTTTPLPVIHCHLFLLDYPKVLDMSKTTITSAECNSGSTTKRSSGSKAAANVEVLVWRKEEWQKVFYHELVHAFGLDSVVQPQKDKDALLVQLVPGYNKSIQEAYTEILASLLAFPFKTISSSSMKDEILFMGCQVNKIIYFFANRTSSSNRNTDDDAAAAAAAALKMIMTFFAGGFLEKGAQQQKSNFASYYILKSIYLWAGLTQPALLDVKNLMNPQFVSIHFYPAIIDSLKSGKYVEWLARIYFKPKNLSLRLTLSVV